MGRITAAALVFLLLFSCVVNADGEGIPYRGYNYDYWGEAVPSPAPYVPEDSISGRDIGVGNFSQASDLFVTSDRIYIADTGNDRLVVVNHHWELVKVINTFENNGAEDKLSAPTGIYVTEDNNIYVADQGNQRIIVLDEQEQVVFQLSDPHSESFDSDFTFIPEKVAVDYAGRIYVVATGVFEGIMNFDDEGDFLGYQGTINVTVNPVDIIWRTLSTKAQREKQVLFIPTEFTNMDMDDDGFIYTTNVDMDSDENIKRLNPHGDDVLRRPENAEVDGDRFYLPPRMDYGGPSRFGDIEVRNDGIYSVLDTRRGRIFTYSHEGDLMYIFGTLGNQVGSFKKPVAIESMKDKLLVLDQERGEITQFEATEYGGLIDQAIRYRYQGDEKASVDLWYDILKLNSNLELAYVGIGKSLLANGLNRKAMDYFELGMDQKYYSIAYKRYRNQWMKDNLGWMLTLAVFGIFFGVILRKSKRRKVSPRYE